MSAQRKKCATTKSPQTTAMNLKVFRPHFQGDTNKPGAVYVKDDNGLLQYGIVVGREGTELLVDFQCGQTATVPVPINKVYRLAERISFTMPTRENVRLQNVPVEILFRTKANERWKWCPGLLLDVLHVSDHPHALVRVFLTNDTTVMACVRDQQIRTPLAAAEIDQLMIHYVQDILIEPHCARTSDPKINQLLPCNLISEIFDCLDTAAQLKVRRVCTLWRVILTANYPPAHVQLRVQGPSSHSLSEFLYIVWHNSTKYLSLTDPQLANNRSSPQLGLGIQSVFEGCGYARLDTLVLTGIILSEEYFDLHNLNEELSSILMSFTNMCHYVLFYNAVIHAAFYVPCVNQNGAKRSFTLTIKRARIYLNVNTSVDQLWDSFDQSERDMLAESVAAHFNQHNRECPCIDRILWVLKYIQGADPRGTPEYSYSRKCWTADSLSTLDPRKLTVIALLAVHACL